MPGNHHWNRRHPEAREAEWELSEDRKSQSKKIHGYELRVEPEDSGWRLYVDGQKRGFYDHPCDARACGVWLAENGNPKFQLRPSENSDEACP